LNGLTNHLTGIDALLQIPQVLPLLILIYPFSPQEVPQEFFTFQLSALAPTNNTSKFNLVVQFSKTPDLYEAKWVASTATATGWVSKAVAKLLQLLISLRLEILN
jgi:hypothetical protein